MDCARTLMIEKNVAIKYQKEAINTKVHTLNKVHLKKDSNQTPYKIWYGYKPNVSYLKVFSSKCYILKKSRKGKFDVKGDEGIFLGHSIRSKAYKCLNLSTHQIIKDKSDGTMTISKLKGTCLLSKFEPRNVKDALENGSYIEEKNLDSCSQA